MVCITAGDEYTQYASLEMSIIVMGSRRIYDFRLFQ